MSDDICIKPSKGSTQRMHKKLSRDNFEELTRFIWRLITQLDVSSWLNVDGVSVCEVFSFETIMHARKKFGACANLFVTRNSE